MRNSIFSFVRSGSPDRGAKRCRAAGAFSPGIFNAIVHTAERGGSLNGRQSEIARALEIADLETKWKARAANDPAEQAHNTWLLAKIDQFRRDPKPLDLPAPPRLPDGSSIGAEE